MFFFFLLHLCDTLIFSKDSFESIHIGTYVIYNYELEDNYSLKISFLGTEDKFTFYRQEKENYYFPNKNYLKVVYEKKDGLLFENDKFLVSLIGKCLLIALLVWLTAFKVFKW